MIKNKVMIPRVAYNPGFVQILQNPNFRCIFSNQSPGGKIKGNKTVTSVKLIVGAEIISIKCFKVSINDLLKRPGDSAVFTYSPEMNSHKDHGYKWNTNTMKNIKSK